MHDGSTRHARLTRARLYLVVTPAAHGPDWEAALEAALDTGVVGMVQLREKEADDRHVLRVAARVRRACDARGALFLVNDRVHLVDDADADGVHVGSDDLPPERAREILGPAQLLGLSTHDETEVAAAAGRGADYAGLGPCFASSSKALSRAPGGAELVRRCLPRAGRLPVFPIGGIDLERAPELVRAGARRLAIGTGVLEAPDPAAAARAFHALLG